MSAVALDSSLVIAAVVLLSVMCMLERVSSTKTGHVSLYMLVPNPGAWAQPGETARTVVSFAHGSHSVRGCGLA